MKKLAKMSLVAAVAVAGMTSTASAAKLSDAVKNTTINGYVRYRLDNGEKAAKESNEYRILLGVTTKVNDNVSAKVQFDGTAATTDASGDADPVLANVTEANFIYTGHGVTAIAGKQALPTPFADPEDQQGTGLVLVAPVGGVTLAGGFFTNSDAQVTTNGNASGEADIIGGNNIAALAVIGKADMVNYALWYARVADEMTAAGEAGATAINVNLTTAIKGVNVEVNYASVDYSGAVGDTLPDPKQSRIVVSGNVSGVTLAAGAVIVDKDGGDVTLGDEDAKANFDIEAFDARILKDTTAYYVAAGMPVGPVNAKIEYGTASEATGTGTDDASELKVSASYAMSKNFKVSAWVTSTSDALEGNDASRLEVKYTF